MQKSCEIYKTLAKQRKFGRVKPKLEFESRFLQSVFDFATFSFFVNKKKYLKRFVK